MTQKQNSKRLKFGRLPRIGVFKSSEISEFKTETLICDDWAVKPLRKWGVELGYESQPPLEEVSVLNLLKRVLVLADRTLLRRLICNGNVSTVCTSIFSHQISPPLF